MSSAVTHFEIYGVRPQALADFYRDVLGWQIEQMPGVHYWRVTPSTSDGENEDEIRPLHGGLTARAIPNLNGWLLYVNVASIEEAESRVLRSGGSIVRPRTAVPRTRWVTIVADPENNIFGIWQPDPKAFPHPEPDQGGAWSHDRR